MLQRSIASRTLRRMIRCKCSSGTLKENDRKKDCWNCHHATDCCEFFCKSCDAIQPITKSKGCDYFKLFQLSKHFKVEQKNMERTYWNLQKRLHPDLYGSKSEFEKELSATNAAVVNDAYKMLKEPTTRVQYLLALHGIDTLSETSSTSVDPQLLVKTMETRERIEEANSLAALHDLRKEIVNEIDRIIQKLSDVYDEQKDLDATKYHAIELQYMVKCAQEIDTREEQMEAEGKR